MRLVRFIVSTVLTVGQSSTVFFTPWFGFQPVIILQLSDYRYCGLLLSFFTCWAVVFCLGICDSFISSTRDLEVYVISYSSLGDVLWTYSLPYFILIYIMLYYLFFKLKLSFITVVIIIITIFVSSIYFDPLNSIDKLPPSKTLEPSFLFHSSVLTDLYPVDLYIIEHIKTDIYLWTMC